MKSRAFVNKIEVAHKEWAEENLGLEPQNEGIDFLVDGLAIELKCRLLPGSSSSITVHYDQFDDFANANPDRTLYWMFLYYEMSKKVKDVCNKDFKDPGLITRREIHFVPWDYIQQFKIWRPKTGPYVYVPYNELPKAKKIVQITRAELHLPDTRLEILKI